MTEIYLTAIEKKLAEQLAEQYELSVDEMEQRLIFERQDQLPANHRCLTPRDDDSLGGAEIVSDAPVAKVVKMTRQSNEIDYIKSFIANEMSRRAADAGLESIDDFQDFDVPDETDEPILSIYQEKMQDMTPEAPESQSEALSADVKTDTQSTENEATDAPQGQSGA
jgi:hypothetical protein